MNDIRRTILWVVFAFSSVLLWDKWQVHNGGQALFFPTPTPAPARQAVKPVGEAPRTDKTGDRLEAVAKGAAISPSLPEQGVNSTPAEKVQVTTDVFKAVIDGQGGTLTQLHLLKYIEESESGGLILFARRLMNYSEAPNVIRPVTLMNDGSEATRYVAQTGLLNPAPGGEPFPNNLTQMVARPGVRDLAEGKDTVDIVFESQSQGGLKYVKTYTFRRGDYAIGVRHQIVNVSDQPREPQLYLRLQRHANIQSNSMFGTSTFVGPAIYTTEKKFNKIEFKDIQNGKAELPPPATNGWIAMVQHYFVSAWLLGTAGGEQYKREFRVAALGNNVYSLAMVLSLPKLAPGASQTIDSQLFAGPEEEKKLEALAPGLELVKDYGIFAIISKPLYWLLDQLYGVLRNWGWAIVALVVLLKIAFYWLNAQAYRSMAKMKAINPKIMEMRERLKDKPQLMQQEMMRIYREEKVNPMGGCFPIMVQIPVFIALYWVLLSSVEMRNAPWALWIHDLSAPDPWFVLPLVMTGTTMFQTWLNPKPPDPMQAKLMWYMPLAFSVMFFFFPSGLVLYWITNNILSIAQQWLINKRMGVIGR